MVFHGVKHRQTHSGILVNIPFACDLTILKQASLTKEKCSPHLYHILYWNKRNYKNALFVNVARLLYLYMYQKMGQVVK